MKRLCTTASILSLRQTPKAVPGSASPQCQPTTITRYNDLQRIEDSLAGCFTGNAGKNHG